MFECRSKLRLFLVLFFIGWIPAALVLEYPKREAGSRSTSRTSRVRVAVVIGSAAVAVAALAIVVPLLTFPLPAPCNGLVRYGLAPNYLKIAGRWQDHIMFQRLVDGA